MSRKVIIIRNATKSDFGGGERFPVFLAQALTAIGYFPIVSSKSAKLLRFAKRSDVTTLKTWWWGQQNWSGWRVLLTPAYVAWQILLYFYYLGMFLVIKPKVVHVQSKDDFIAATLAGRTVLARVVWTDHADLKHVWLNVRKPFKNPVGKLVLMCARLAHSITVVSNSELALVSANLRPGSSVARKLTVVYNGAFDERKPKPSTGNATEFLVASRLVKDKGVQDAIVAFAKLNKTYKNTHLTIVGGGAYKDKLVDLAVDSNVTFTGHVDNPLDHMAAADVFIHPTYHEGFSVALVEASMQGLAVVATNVGGNPEIITDNENGILIEPKDIDGLYSALLRLHTSSELREKLASANRKAYEDNFEFNKIVKERFVPIYENSHRSK